VQGVDRDLDEALGQEYVARAFAGDSKQRMLKLVHALEAALNTDIQQLDWMSPATRKAAIAKLDKIGYPDHWRDSSSLKIVRGDALGNAYRSGEFELQRRLSRIGRPVDRAEWSVSPSVPNPYYDAQLNAITFPAAILQPPLFDPQSDDAANFGAIGAIIGHELTHGFDDQGRKFDGAGNLRDWWTAEDGEQFDKKEQCVADEYSGFEATEGVKLNGNLTLGENTADNGGLRIAFMALESILSGEDRARTDRDGFTPAQRFFIALRRVLVLECDAPIPPHAGAVQPPFDAAGARERSGIQHAGVSEGLRLQEEAAHGARECLSRLVGVEHVRRQAC
jgi:putative endopeptidase